MSDFPNNPTPNQEFSIGTKIWFWDDAVETWRIKAAGTVGPQGNQGPTGIGDIAEVSADPPRPTDSASGIVFYDSSTDKYSYDRKIFHAADLENSNSQISLPVLVEFAENIVSGATPSITASGKTIDIDFGTLHYLAFSGYTGAATITITGSIPSSPSSGLAQSFVLFIGNTGGYDTPTLSFTGGGNSVLFTQETGAPVFEDGLTAIYAIPFTILSTGTPYRWLGGSQVTYEL